MATTINRDPERLLINANKRKSVALASITWLNHCLRDLEANAGAYPILELAQSLSQKCSDVDSKFRKHHRTSLLTDKETLAKEHVWTLNC